MYDFDFATSSWSPAELTGKPLSSLTHYLAVCHQGSLLVMGGVEFQDEREHGASHIAHRITPHFTSPADDGPDISSMRYQLGSDLRKLAKKRQFTDLTLQVDGRRWQVHRMVLASCSPFFKQLLQCSPTSGTHFSSF